MPKEKPPFLTKVKRAEYFLLVGFYRFVVLQYRIASVMLAQE